MGYFFYKPMHWLKGVLICSIFFSTSCFWVNEPNEEEMGNLELTDAEKSGENYTYKILLNDSTKPNLGFGFIIYINDREIIHQSHENTGEAISSYNSFENASYAAKNMINKLKNAAKEVSDKKASNEKPNPLD